MQFYYFAIILKPKLYDYITIRPCQDHHSSSLLNITFSPQPYLRGPCIFPHCFSSLIVFYFNFNPYDLTWFSPFSPSCLTQWSLPRHFCFSLHPCCYIIDNFPESCQMIAKMMEEQLSGKTEGITANLLFMFRCCLFCVVTMFFSHVRSFVIVFVHGTHIQTCVPLLLWTQCSQIRSFICLFGGMFVYCVLFIFFFLNNEILTISRSLYIQYLRLQINFTYPCG